METYILKKSDKKGKRFVIIMEGMKHHFGSDVGSTFIDGRTEKEKKAWEARHRKDRNYNNKHSGIYFSRFLLWGDHPDLKKNVKALEKKDKVKIKIQL